MLSAEALVRAAIAERGPLPFSEVVELALYHDDAGFYAAGGRAGRRGDFLTSPEVGPLFGAVVARAIDAWWETAGQPDKWTVVDAGAGQGTLARAVLAAEPACAAALHWVLVERSAEQRELHHDLLDRSTGRVTSQADLPASTGAPTVVLANELLDNLPFDLLERTATGWAEVLVESAGDGFAERLGPVRVGPPPGAASAPVGARIPVQGAAATWLGSALDVAGPGGRVVVFDYASTTADLAARPVAEWLRTYRGHQRGGPPFEALGLQDITCEVCVDQLTAVAETTSDRLQADWLRAHGIDDLVAEGRSTWEERASIGDLAAIRARSRITEAEALLDPDGLGAFRVLEWLNRDRAGPTSPGGRR